MTCGFIKIIGNIFLKFFIYLGIYRAFWAFLTRVCESLPYPTSQSPACELHGNDDYKPIRQPEEPKIRVDERKVIPQELYADEPQIDNEPNVDEPNVDEANVAEVNDDEDDPNKQISTPKPPIRRYQNYTLIKGRCLRRKVLFEDPEFPTDLYKSVFIKEKNKKDVEAEIKATESTVNWEWRRPNLDDDPKFYREVPNQLCIRQGYVGNCWFISAVSTLATRPELMYRVAPPQSFDEEDYAGIFRFKFWQYGKWIDIVVDDRLLYANDKLAFAKPEFDEYVYPLLEKAYAKLYGAYFHLVSSTGTEALVDLTGGMVHIYPNLRLKATPIFFKDLLRSYEMEAVMSCGKFGIPGEREAVTREGLVAGHAYSVTMVAEVLVEEPDEYGNVNTYIESLIKIRNPWGAQEWNGRWSDKAEEWTWISKEDKIRLHRYHQEDGEFWMTFQEFMLHFHFIEIVDLTPDSFFSSRMRPWSHGTIHSEWTRGVSAAGYAKPEENPHILFTITDPDKIFEDGKCMVSISLMQKHRRYFFGDRNLFISFSLYHVPPTYRNTIPLPQRFFYKHKAIYFMNHEGRREINERFRLPPGTYLIVPTTFHPDLEGQFLIRVFTSGQLEMREDERDLAIVAPKGKLEDMQYEEEMQRYQEMFEQLNKTTIGWKQLKTIMDYFGSTVPHFKGFYKETVRSVISVMDEDHDGQIEEHEFDSLICRLLGMKVLFVENDKDKTGHIPASSMQEIILSLANQYGMVGIEINQKFLKLICHRFGKDDGSFSFDDYILCLIRIQAATEAFEAAKGTKRRKAKVTFQQWLEVELLT